jgi:ATP-binding cassette subfamily B protein
LRILGKIKKGGFYIVDPATKRIVFTEEEFKRCRIRTKTGEEDTGTALLLEPGTEFWISRSQKTQQEERQA